jgi:hypothetical protein
MTGDRTLDKALDKQTLLARVRPVIAFASKSTMGPLLTAEANLN